MIATLFSPLLPDKFDESLSRQVGKNYATFYSGRNGLYYVLVYLKRKYGAHRIHLSTYFENAGQSVPLVSKEAGYEIIWNDGAPKAERITDNDLVLVTDKGIDIFSARKRIFTVQDSASNLQAPSGRFDFAMYSFNQDKPMSAAGGGVILVINPEFLDFLEVRKQIKPISGSEERTAYLNAIKWKIRSYKAVRSLGRIYLRVTKGREGAAKDAIWNPAGKFHHLEYDMPRISRRLACDYLPISGSNSDK